jgi:uncharacterized membrane protein
MAVVTYLVYLGGVLHLVPFTQGAVLGAMAIVFLIGIIIKSPREPRSLKWKPILAEEIFFFLCILFWSWVKAHEPSIHNLEKFMDFGFTKSILTTRFFPAPDMWYAGGMINYYYFGHTVMAVLTRLSGIDLTYTFNLMLAAIFALCFTMSFSIGCQLSNYPINKLSNNPIKKIISGALTAFLVTLAGNMQTIYAFTKGYDGEHVEPFWTLLGKIDLARYWYPNATRFIPYTIHEFPSYSFVVSDVHGHVLSIPFVLLAIALLINIWGSKGSWGSWGTLIFYGFLSSVLLMTNALDGPIYFGLFAIILVISNFQYTNNPIIQWWKPTLKALGIVSVATIITSLPFLLHFKSFVNGIAVNCPPAALANIKIGPILLEGVEKCQHSPLWMFWLLWGFFIYCGAWLFFSKKKNFLLTVFFFFSLALIIFPEFFYFKDIYPMHFRSNTMFKLGYQAFIMFSIVAGYAIVKFFRNKIFLLLLIPQLFLVSIYPVFSVRSYFNSLKHYESIGGAGWIARQYPDDWAGIEWLNTQIGSPTSLKLRGATTTGLPVIVEADGDSYTDYNRVSAFTGLPTIVGWSVHEWLWRGGYDVVAPRKEEVRRIYESTDINETKQILTKYHVRYVFVGQLERKKFTTLQEWKFSQLGKPVFTSGETVIYEVHGLQ